MVYNNKIQCPFFSLRAKRHHPYSNLAKKNIQEGERVNKSINGETKANQ